MKLARIAQIGDRKEIDLLVLPFWEEGKPAADVSLFQGVYREPLASGDFHGKSGESLLCYGPQEKRLCLLGLGKAEGVTLESLRRAYAAAMRVAQGKKVRSIHLILPNCSSIARMDLLRAMAEGLFLTNYLFVRFKKDSLKDHPFHLVEQLIWVGVTQEEFSGLERALQEAEAVFFARDLVNGNADEVTPQMLADTARQLELISSKVRIELWDQKRLEQERMGLILAVARAATCEPFLIQGSYRGAPHSEEHVVLVGKGVTYDTGGLSLKPTDGMLTMKCDMAGAATVLALLRIVALLDLKVNVTILAPVVENAIGPNSYKVGDVYTSYSGKTIEVNNTDAEGRLILADALSYAVRTLQPTCIIDLATLTGAVLVALGEDISGLFVNDEALHQALMCSSHETGELLWRLPLHADYKESLKSDVADLVNSGGRDAGSMKGALFLAEFVGTVPWAHIDCAGSAYLSKPKHYHPTRGTGFGVRLLLDFLVRNCSRHGV